MERYVCIHGHFYQPPRENPWLEAIELQDSADPYHDWNERITAECYEPNAASRILDHQGRIEKIVNNYARISFNFGPTLLAWLESKEPTTYEAILAADRESQQRFGDHGSALAQAYNHLIMPLANSRDRLTQVIWGIRDFEHRFGRRPEGMWLPETAVDDETLEILVEQGIRFTILSPYQASKVRRKGRRDWQDVSGGRIDPTRPYLIRLPSGASITLFFYDGPISQAVAFEHLLSSGERFADRILSGFHEERDWSEIMHIATDGETYGHHHAHGDMALAYALEHIESNGVARLTNYASYLAKHPPTYEVEIFEDSAWSCSHGVERWRSDCGCSTGMNAGWNQAWRTPLREALNWLRDELAIAYEREARSLFIDPWATRNAYIEIMLDRSTENVDGVLQTCAGRALTAPERITALKLLEMQRHAQLMYTSCGWFFDDLSNIETIQVLQYAGRAIQLGRDLFGDSLEEPFLRRLERAQSNIRSKGSGRQIWEQAVIPAMVDLPKVAAHYGISSVFRNYQTATEVYSYDAELKDFERAEAGRASLAAGQVTIRSRITGETDQFSFGALHFGDHNLVGGVRTLSDGDAYHRMRGEISDSFRRADFANVVRQLDRHFGPSMYSLKSLFRDEQRSLLGEILRSTIEDTESVYRHIYEDNAPLLRYLSDLGTPPPRALEMAATFVLNFDLREAFERDTLDIGHIQDLLDDATMLGVDLGSARLRHAIRMRVELLTSQFRSEPSHLPALQRLAEMVQIANAFPIDVDLWECQNAIFEASKTAYPMMLLRAQHGHPLAVTWVEQFRALGAALKVRIRDHE